MSATRVALLLVVIALLSVTASMAQTVTGFKTSEKTTGMTKQCFYDALGSVHTRTVSAVSLCPLSIQVEAVPRPTPNTRATTPARTPRTIVPAPRPERATVTAFKTGERTTGLTKQCFYDALGSAYTETVSSVSLCPLSIKVRPGGF